MVETRYGDNVAGHVSRDSTASDAREKATGTKPEKPKPFRSGHQNWQNTLAAEPRRAERGVLQEAPPFD